MEMRRAVDELDRRAFFLIADDVHGCIELTDGPNVAEIHVERCRQDGPKDGTMGDDDDGLALVLCDELIDAGERTLLQDASVVCILKN